MRGVLGRELEGLQVHLPGLGKFSHCKQFCGFRIFYHAREFRILNRARELEGLQVHLPGPPVRVTAYPSRFSGGSRRLRRLDVEWGEESRAG